MRIDSYGTKYGTAIGTEGHGQSVRRLLPDRRNHIRQEVRIACPHKLYLSVHDHAQPAQIFLRVKGADCSSELIGLYDVIARLMSLALQDGASLEKVGDLLAGAKPVPWSPVSGHDRKQCWSLPNLIGRHLLVEYRGRHELAHAPLSTSKEEAP